MDIFHKWKPYKVSKELRVYLDFPEREFIVSLLWVKCTICKTLKRRKKEYPLNLQLSDFE